MKTKTRTRQRQLETMNNHRQRALEKYGSECVSCGATDEIEVHHIDGNQENTSLVNLMPLCRHCHRKLHNDGLAGLD